MHMCASLFMYATCVGAGLPKGEEEDTVSPGARVIDCCEPPSVNQTLWESNSGLLQEQQELIAVAPSLQLYSEPFNSVHMRMSFKK